MLRGINKLTSWVTIDLEIVTFEGTIRTNIRNTCYWYNF